MAELQPVPAPDEPRPEPITPAPSAGPVMDVVVPPPQANPPTDSPVPAPEPAKPSETKPVQPTASKKTRKQGVTAAIIATVIIVLGLAALAVIAFLKQK